MNSTDEKKPRKKKRVGFYFWYAILCGFLILILTVSIALFYDFIREYERTRPEHIAKDYILSLDGQALSEMFGEEIRARSSGFETDDAISDAIFQAFEEGIVFTQCVGEESPAYDVFCGGKMMKVCLRQASEGKYGFAHYEVGETRLYPEWVDGRFTAARVIVPEKTALQINGVRVPDDYRTGAEYKSAVLSRLDLADPTLVEYAVENIFGSVTITGEYDGQTLEFSRLSESGVYYSDFDLPTLFDYTLKVPADAKVTFNGVELSKDYITQTAALPEAVGEFEANSAPQYSFYTVKGLISQPKVEAELAGEMLVPLSLDQTQCVFSIPKSFLQDYTVKVPHDLKLYCNGIEVGAPYCTENCGFYQSPYEPLPASVQYDVYTFSLYSTPEFKVSAENAVCRQSEREITFYPVLEESQDSQLRDEAQLFAELFIKYSLQGGSKVVQANYDECMKHVLPGSEAYHTIAGTLNAFKYNSTYQIEKLETRVYDLIRYSDECFGVKVDFESLGVANRHEKPANGTYTMVWTQSDGQWKLVMFSL